MTDLHTHILPGMDDGAADAEESLALLRMERQQGVGTVALTPHFYRRREDPKSFLARRAESCRALEERIAALPEEERRDLPRLVLGAEVAWAPGLSEWEELPALCLGGTKNLLLELPFSQWNDGLIHQLYDLMGRTGITPVIAHLERYMKIQRREHIEAVLDLGVPVQISGDIFFSWLQRMGALKMLRRGEAHIIASDCHHVTGRVPNLGDAMAVVREKLGDSFSEQLSAQAAELLER